MKSTPYIVENQCGSIDIAQSIDANVTVSPYATSPADERSCSRRATGRSPVASCSSDHRLRKYAKASHAAK